MSTAVLVPQAGESISEGELGKWLKTEGDFVEVDEIIAEIETEKASMEVRAPVSGLLNLKVEEGSVVEVGKKIAEIVAGKAPAEKASAPAGKAPIDKATPAESQPTNTAQAAQASPPPAAHKEDKENKDLHATPAARKLLSESGTPLSTVIPSGPAGRVNQEDVKNAIDAKAKIEVTSHTTEKAVQPQVAMGNRDREVTKKRMSMLRRTVASRLSEAQKISALLTTFNEVDMAAVMKMRKKYKEKFKETHETSLGFMSFFTKAVCHALQKFPIINSRIEGEDILQYHYCDIGIAVATEKGLVVPAVRNAQTMSFAEIEKSILALAQKGKAGKLSIEDLSGGTFTITNGGIFGSMLSTPIVNYPQSAILGLHNIVERPVVVDGEIVIRPIMYVALTYDHRLIDGAQAVRFLYTVKEMIEDPNRLLLAV